MVESINTREFEHNSPCWKSLAPSFKAGPFDGCTVRPLSGPAFVAYLAQICEHTPDWHLRVLDSKTHFVEETQTMVVYTNIAVTGHSPGIVSYTTFVTDYRAVGGQWLVTALNGLGTGHA